MKFLSLLVLLAVILLTSAPASSAPPTRWPQLTVAQDITDAEKLNATLRSLEAKTFSCVMKGKQTPGDCRCQLKEELTAMTTVYNETLALHPQWEDEIMGYTDANGKERILSMVKILRMHKICTLRAKMMTTEKQKKALKHNQRK